jgi:hypothetical protein
MDQKIDEAIKFVYSYAPDITEWVILKKELLKLLSADKRKLFSTRDPVTKKTNFNEFEQSIIEHWKVITGKELYLSKYETKK